MTPIMEAFPELYDPRCRECRYPLEEIVFTALCAVLCGVDDWETMTLWGRTQQTWLRKRLPYANGVPSPDTFRRVFSALNPVVFERCFIAWVGQLCPSLAGQHVAIDGKAVRGSRTREHQALHLVSAWCSNVSDPSNPTLPDIRHSRMLRPVHSETERTCKRDWDSGHPT